MKRLRKFFGLSWEDQFFHVRVLVILVLVRIGLSTIPFAKLQKLLSRSIPTASKKYSADQIRIAVLRASRFVPRSTCLVQALTAERLFRRQGEPVVITLGVTSAEKQFEAHAWVVKEGSIVIGNRQDIEKYKALASFENGRVQR